MIFYPRVLNANWTFREIKSLFSGFITWHHDGNHLTPRLSSMDIVLLCLNLRVWVNIIGGFFLAIITVDGKIVNLNSRELFNSENCSPESLVLLEFIILIWGQMGREPTKTTF